MNFRIRGLEARQFDHLFALSDAELAEHGAVRRIAEGPRPCRISLSDAKPGDELILVNYEHHPVSSPYRMRFAPTFAAARKRSMPSEKYRSSFANVHSPCAALIFRG
jgi:Protein of unknown function (DUF1203)